MEGNLFLLSWDMMGLEAVINITDLEKDAIWQTLQDKPTPKLNHIVNAIMIRARANSQRHYEIYTITVDDGIAEEDIREMFDNDPQGSADLIRERGHKIYSGRADKQTQRIV